MSTQNGHGLKKSRNYSFFALYLKNQKSWTYGAGIIVTVSKRRKFLCKELIFFEISDLLHNGCKGYDSMYPTKVEIDMKEVS